MLDEATDGGMINDIDADILRQWHSDPESWTPLGFDAVD